MIKMKLMLTSTNNEGISKFDSHYSNHKTNYRYVQCSCPFILEVTKKSHFLVKGMFPMFWKLKRLWQYISNTQTDKNWTRTSTCYWYSQFRWQRHVLQRKMTTVQTCTAAHTTARRTVQQRTALYGVRITNNYQYDDHQRTTPLTASINGHIASMVCRQFLVASAELWGALNRSEIHSWTESLSVPSLDFQSLRIQNTCSVPSTCQWTLSRK